MTITEVMQSSHVFRRLNPEQLSKLVNIAHEENYRPGEYIFKTGSQARNFYIIEEGEVELQVGISVATSTHVAVGGMPVEECTEKIGIISTGTSLGWATLAGQDVIIGCARAIGKCRLIALDGIKLRELMDSDVTLGYEVMKQFSQQLANSIDALGQMLVRERGLLLMREEMCH